MIEITEKRLVSLFKISERKIRDDFKSVRVGTGKYDLLGCIDIYVENTQGKNDKIELDRVNKELQEFKLGILKKEYYSVEEVDTAVSDMLFNFKSKLLSLPRKLSNKLKNIEENEWEETIEKMVDGALEEIRGEKNDSE
jgi:hypothetical protein